MAESGSSRTVQRLEHVNPTTGKTQASFPVAGDAEVDAAVQAAQSALPAWRRPPPAERRRLLARLAGLVRQHGEELITISMLECGIPSTEARAAITAEWFDQAAGWAERLYGDVIPADPALFDYTIHEPVGVVGILVTWNAPLNSLGLTIAPPLAAGCTVVLKPSELAPFTALRFGAICLEAGIPPGVVNVLAGAAQPEPLSYAITASRRSASPAGGRPRARSPPRVPSAQAGVARARRQVGEHRLRRRRPRRGDPHHAHLHGAKRPGLPVPSRLLVQRSVHDAFMERVAAAAAAVKIGDPFDPGTAWAPSSAGRLRTLLG